MAELETLGESGELGWLLLTLLGKNGWTIDILPGFAGDTTIVAATRPGYDPVVKSGASAAAVAVDVVKDCTQQHRAHRRVA